VPTYEYRCDVCGHAFEQFQSITASPLKKCPGCGKLKLKRLIGSGVGLIFKGSGFYETDYRSEGYKKAAQGETPAAAKSADKKETASTTPAETKTEAAPKKAGKEQKSA